MQSFELSKWYADCVSDDGSAIILYHARLRWRSVSLHYSSLLRHAPNVSPTQHFSLRRSSEPAVAKEAIHWRSRALNAVGKWDHLGAGQREVLLEGKNGSLDWSCIAPRAQASVTLGAGAPLRGWGYVERLSLTLPPWQLPIRRLRWGRFVNATDAMVWIDWEGAHTVRVVYLNGASVSATAIDDATVVLDGNGGMLSLQESVVLRTGQLGSTALSVIPRVERILPAAILNARECKWLSRAVLRRPGSPDSVGMAIHEVVEWP